MSSSLIPLNSKPPLVHFVGVFRDSSCNINTLIGNNLGDFNHIDGMSGINYGNYCEIRVLKGTNRGTGCIINDLYGKDEGTRNIILRRHEQEPVTVVVLGNETLTRFEDLKDKGVHSSHPRTSVTSDAQGFGKFTMTESGNLKSMHFESYVQRKENESEAVRRFIFSSFLFLFFFFFFNVHFLWCRSLLHWTTTSLPSISRTSGASWMTTWRLPRKWKRRFGKK